MIFRLIFSYFFLTFYSIYSFLFYLAVKFNIIEAYNVKMNTIPYIKCPSCKVRFGFDNTPKILRNCQHTICINCLKTLKNCPLDQIEINTNKFSIKNFLTNTQILQYIQNQAQQGKQLKLNCRGTITPSKTSIQKNTVEKLDNSQGWQVCNLHIRKAIFLCKEDCKFLCSLCISNGNHKGHQITSCEEMLGFLTNFTDSSFKVYDKIREKSEILTKRKAEQYIISQMNKKQQKQICRIRTFYQKIIEKIRKQQKELLLELEQKKNQATNDLKELINFVEHEKRKQDFAKEVYELTKVVDEVYNGEEIQKAFAYLNQSSQSDSLLQRGNLLFQFITQVEQNLHRKVQEKAQNLQFSYNEDIFKKIQNLCYFQSQSIKKNQFNSNFSDRFQKRLDIKSVFSLSINLKHQTVVSPKIQSQNQIQQNSQLSEDFLLESMKQISQNQNYTQKQITFEENYSLISPVSIHQEQFTPILRKQQDSITEIQQNTIQNQFKSQKNRPIFSIRSDQITIDFKKIRKNSLIGTQSETQLAQLSKTLTKETSRSPLTPLKSNTPSKVKKNEIPQKYIPIWQNARQDRSEVIDLTGAQLGNNLILHLGGLISSSKKIHSLKLIRNKLTDQITYELISIIRQTNISSLNLSQNYLTEKSIDILQSMDLGNLKSITLSLNKIILRKVKDRILRFKQKGIILTV